MTFNKSLAVFGLLASVATPAAAYDLSEFADALESARARVGGWIEFSSSSSRRTVVAPTITAPVVTTPQATRPTLTTPVVTAPVVTTPTVTTPTVTTPTVTTPTVTSPAVTVPAVTTPTVSAPAVSASSTRTTTTSTVSRTTLQSTARTVSPRASLIWSESGSDADTESLLAKINAAVQSWINTGTIPTVTTPVVTTPVVTTPVVTPTPEAPVTEAPVTETPVIAAPAPEAGGVVDTVTEVVEEVIETVVEVVTDVADAVVGAVADGAQTVAETLTKLVDTSSPLVPVAGIDNSITIDSGTSTDSSTPGGSLLVASPSPDTGGETIVEEARKPQPDPQPDTAEVIGGNGATYYVDFEAGNDANSGTSPSQPWKRAPGDASAAGNAASAVLKPGDTVRFKAGVAYRGTITVKQAGTAASPIIYTGTGFGTGRAIWDGADAVTSVVSCPSQSACGGAANWQSLKLVTYADPTAKNKKLYDALGPLYEAQSPTQTDAFWDDNLDEFAVIPVAQAAAVAAGRLENAALAEAARGQTAARVAIWVQGNTVVERAVLSVSGNVITFDGTGLKPYTDRDGKAAVVGSVKALTKPGLYAVVGAGKAVLYPRSGGGSSYFVGTGRYAFDLRGKSGVTIHGLDFLRGTGSRGSTREGVAVANYGGAVTDVQIVNNSFRNYSMQNGYGAVMLNNVTNLVVSGNRLENLEGASGMRFGASNANLTIENNILRRLGRTGIYMGGVTGAVVRGNILSEMLGVHGNGMSYYESNSNITVSGNCVFGTTRPLTFYGSGTAGVVNNLKFTGNIFITSDTGRSAVYSWGSTTRTVLFDNNYALGTRAGFILNASDLDVTASRNRTAGLLISGSADTTPSGWTLTGNDNMASYDDAASATLSASYCSAAGVRGQLTIGVA